MIKENIGAGGIQNSASHLRSDDMEEPEEEEEEIPDFAENPPKSPPEEQRARATGALVQCGQLSEAGLAKFADEESLKDLLAAALKEKATQLINEAGQLDLTEVANALLVQKNTLQTYIDEVGVLLADLNSAKDELLAKVSSLGHGVPRAPDGDQALPITEGTRKEAEGAPSAGAVDASAANPGGSGGLAIAEGTEGEQAEGSK